MVFNLFLLKTPLNFEIAIVQENVPEIELVQAKKKRSKTDIKKQEAKSFLRKALTANLSM